MAEERAVAFLKGLQIKTTAFGGFDKTDTYSKFKELALIYEDVLAAERSETEKEKKENVKLCEDLAEKTDKQLQMSAKIEQLEAEKSELMRKAADSTKLYLQKERFNRESEDAAFRESEDILKRAQNKSDAILSDTQCEAERMLSVAKSERENILNSARDEALRYRAEIEEEVVSLRREKSTVLMELKVIQTQLKNALKSEKDE